MLEKAATFGSIAAGAVAIATVIKWIIEKVQSSKATG